MFTADFAIDTIQTGKKAFVNTFVQHEGTKKAMIEFIDAQADYTKEMVKTSTKLATKLADESMKAAQEVTKFDLSKFDFSKAFTTKK